jgi:hypothetical protein
MACAGVVTEMAVFVHIPIAARFPGIFDLHYGLNTRRNRRCSLEAATLYGHMDAVCARHIRFRITGRTYFLN